jgi:hypothetical protein
MDPSSRRHWIGAAILIGVSYGVIGVVFALPSDQVRTWRLAAWVVSAAVYAVHIGYELFRLHNSPRATALHAAMAVAVGAFLLAVAATVHKTIVVSQAPDWRFLLALVVWPIITAVPAFLVALVAGTVLARLPTKRLAE